jgi:hypothetical protein
MKKLVLGGLNLGDVIRFLEKRTDTIEVHMLRRTLSSPGGRKSSLKFRIWEIVEDQQEPFLALFKHWKAHGGHAPEPDMTFPLSLEVRIHDNMITFADDDEFSITLMEFKKIEIVQSIMKNSNPARQVI